MKWSIFFSLLLLGCSDYLVTKVEERVPEILVHPENLDFEHLISGNETKTLVINVINVGDEELYLDPPFLSDGDERYSFIRQS